MSYKSFSIFAFGFGLVTVANAISRYSDYQTFNIISIIGNAVLSAYFIQEVIKICNNSRSRPLVHTTLTISANALITAASFTKLLNVMQPTDKVFNDTQKGILTAMEVTTNCIWIANFLFFTMHGKDKVFSANENTIPAQQETISVSKNA